MGDPGASGPGDSTVPDSSISDASLSGVLDEARRAGFLGSGPIEPQVRHAEGFGVVGRRLTRKCNRASQGPRLADLGSGGGLPGLVVAVRWPETHLVLIEAGARRAAFLRTAVQRLGIGERVAVLEERAERAGRQPEIRGTFDGVLARSFGRPAVVAECAAPLLRVGGWIVVSEPPASKAGESTVRNVRWPTAPLDELGLVLGALVTEPFAYRILRQRDPCPDRFPRRNGAPAKRPLF